MRKISIETVSLAYYEWSKPKYIVKSENEGGGLIETPKSEFIPYLVNYAKEHREAQMKYRLEKKNRKNITP